MLSVAFGTIDITPPVGLPLGGNVRADRDARGVHDPLFATVAVIDDLVMVGMDLLFVTEAISAPVKDKIVAELGLPADNVVLFASHTHSGPQLSGDSVSSVTSPSDNPETDRWMGTLPQRIVSGVREIYDRRESAQLRLSTLDVPGLAFNRRLRLRDGSTHMNWENLDPADVECALGPVDDELTVLQAIAADGRTLGIIVHFTLHAAVLVGHDWLYSRDFVGPLVRTVQEGLGDPVPVLYANGTEGNINHIDYNGGRSDDPFAETERIGGTLGRAVLDALPRGRELSGSVEVTAAPIALRRRAITEDMLAAAQELMDACGGVVPSLLDGVPEEAYAKWTLERAKNYDPEIPIRPVVARIGELVLAFTPGESFVEFGLGLRQRFGNHVVKVFGLANASIGYIPTESSFAQGGYEPKFGTSTIEPGQGEVMFSAVADAVESLLAER